MYIVYNNNAYPCRCRPAADMVYMGLPEDFPAPIDGEIALCADDGFVLRTDNTADYLRQTFENGTLVLTNTPEPPPVEPDEPTDDGDADIYDEMATAYDEGVQGA